MLFNNITILDENFEIKENMYVVIEGERIKYIGKEKPQITDQMKETEYDGKNKLLMPGFYNSHAHSPMSPMQYTGGHCFPMQSRLGLESFHPARCIILWILWQKQRRTAVSRQIFPGQ